MLMEDHSRLSLGVLIILVFLTLASSSCSKCLDGSCDSNGLCITGCVAGYADKKCQHRCQSTCKSFKCDVDMDTGKLVCSEGCEDGYCGLQCKSPCLDGCLQCDRHTCHNCNLCRSSLYGEACQHSCFHKCLGFACDNTGRCQNECMDGYYGVNCTKTCNQRYGKCDMLTGTCIRCILGFYGEFCKYPCPSCLPTAMNSYKCESGCVRCRDGRKDTVTQQCLNHNPDDIYFLFGVCISFLVLLVVMNVACFRHRRHRFSICCQRRQILTSNNPLSSLAAGQIRHGSLESETDLRMDIAEDPE